jgi:hypothetical protein
MGSFSRMTCTMGPARSQDGAITCVFTAGTTLSCESDKRDYRMWRDLATIENPIIMYNGAHTTIVWQQSGMLRGRITYGNRGSGLWLWPVRDRK